MLCDSDNHINVTTTPLATNKLSHEISFCTASLSTYDFPSETNSDGDNSFMGSCFCDNFFVMGRFLAISRLLKILRGEKLF